MNTTASGVKKHPPKAVVSHTLFVCLPEPIDVLLRAGEEMSKMEALSNTVLISRLVLALCKEVKGDLAGESKLVEFFTQIDTPSGSDNENPLKFGNMERSPELHKAAVSGGISQSNFKSLFRRVRSQCKSLEANERLENLFKLDISPSVEFIKNHFRVNPGISDLGRVNYSKLLTYFACLEGVKEKSTAAWILFGFHPKEPQPVDDSDMPW